MRLKGSLVLGGALALLPAALTAGGDRASAAAVATPTPTARPIIDLPFLDVEPGPTATPSPEPAATPPPGDLQPARLHLGQVRRAGGKLRVVLSARGGSFERVRVVLRRDERTLKAVTIAKLSGTRKLTLKPRKGRLVAGTYYVRVTVGRVIAADREVMVSR